LAERYGGKWRVGPSRGRIRHSITDHRFEIDVRAGELDGGREIGEGPTAGWFQRAQIGALPVSSLVGKVLARLENGG
jgi:hypothetical protein